MRMRWKVRSWMTKYVELLTGDRLGGCFHGERFVDRGFSCESRGVPADFLPAMEVR